MYCICILYIPYYNIIDTYIYCMHITLHRENLAGAKIGRFAQRNYWQFLNLADLPKTLLAIIPGTEKCLVALAGPFSVAYFPILGV